MTRKHQASRRATIRQLRPDPQNANRGTERGAGMIERSLRAYGAGRSLLVDKHGVVIAGNKTLEAAASIGLEEVVVVRTDGRKLVVVQRTDLDLARDAQAKELAIADNRAAQVGLDWDPAVLEELKEAGVDLGEFWSDQELSRLLASADAAPAEDDAPERWAVLVDCKNEADQKAVIEAMEQAGRPCRALIS